MILGMKTLTYSASFFEDDEEEEPCRFEKFLDRVFGEKLESVIMSIVMVLSFIPVSYTHLDVYKRQGLYFCYSR